MVEYLLDGIHRAIHKAIEKGVKLVLLLVVLSLEFILQKLGLDLQNRYVNNGCSTRKLVTGALVDWREQ